MLNLDSKAFQIHLEPVPSDLHLILFVLYRREDQRGIRKIRSCESEHVRNGVSADVAVVGRLGIPNVSDH